MALSLLNIHKSEQTTLTLKKKILFKDILTFIGLDFRYASLITLYLVAIGISIPKKDVRTFLL